MTRAGTVLLLAATAVYLSACRRTDATDRLPNIVIIYADDVGYGDIGVYGNGSARTPNLDRLAAEGLRFTNFYIPVSACSPSRAALMTGRYPNRAGIRNVLSPRSRIGLDPTQVTIAEILRDRGYATAAVGKWHLGDHPKFLPTNHGFDSYFGLPYSNDMSPVVANNPRERARKHPPLPLIRDTTVVEREPDQHFLTRRYTDEAVSFIRSHADRPFFLYFAHMAAHVPLYASPEFEGLTGAGLYADVIAEMDWSVGTILQVLAELGLSENTFVFFASDNGPWLVMGDHAGSAGALREGKATSFDGGHKEPAIAWWPSRIEPGGVTDAIASIMDLLPTVTSLAGGALPDDYEIDGHDISSFFTGQERAESPYDHLFYFRAGRLQAVRSGRWKLHVPHSYVTLEGGRAGNGGFPGVYASAETGLALYDLVSDPGETVNLVDRHPDVAAEMNALIDSGLVLFGDRSADIRGSAENDPGRVDSAWAVQRR